ncbi:MAG: hypothetical protein C5B56_00685 [Proteobacteria bacterium]|nr:MAG: hypothetical protein C5B56_00685 [Pseudomonadota bacterium]
MSWDAESWKQAARDYHKERGDRRTIVETNPARRRRLRALLDDRISHRAWSEIARAHMRGRAAQSTVDVLVFSLRRGVGALKDPDTLRRLMELDSGQVREVALRVMKFMPGIAKPWTFQEVEALVTARSGAYGQQD